jgi:GT2 family glycosyltransferase
MNLSVIIPNYNGQDLLRKNMPKVFNAMADYKNGKTEVIVVDDFSTDNSLDILKELKLEMNDSYPNIMFRIIENEKNLGFSSNINKGVRNATGEILILLNTDVFPERDFLIPLLGNFQDDQIFAVGCMDKSIEGEKTILRGRGVGKWSRGFFVHSRGEVNRDNTLWVNGGSGAFRKSIWDKLGGFDDLYKPFYWEDIDLSYRALKSGYKICFEPKSIVTHEHEKGAINSTYSDFRIKTVAYKNQFVFIWKNITDLDLRALHLLWLPFYFIKSLLKGDLAFIVGFSLALLRLPQATRSSIRTRKYFIKSDKEILANFTQ